MIDDEENENTIDFATKYRPKSLKGFVCSESIKSVLTPIVEDERVPPVILIAGRTSSGKTTLARILANKVLGVKNCEECPDYTEINMGNERGIDAARGIVETMKYKPRVAKKRVIVLDEVHTITPQAASSLLKPLEQPPAHVVVILCTDQPEKLLQTIVNRCTTIKLEIPTPDEIIVVLKRVCKKEGLKLDEDTLRLISEAADGQPRKALKILQSLWSTVNNSKNVKKALELAKLNIIKQDDDSNIINFLLGLYRCNSKIIMECISNTNDFNALINKALEFHRFMFDNVLKENGITCNRYYFSYKRNELYQGAKKIRSDYLRHSIRVHNFLVDMKKEMGSYYINEYHLLMARALEAMQNWDKPEIKKVKG